MYTRWWQCSWVRHPIPNYADVGNGFLEHWYRVAWYIPLLVIAVVSGSLWEEFVSFSIIWPLLLSKTYIQAHPHILNTISSLSVRLLCIPTLSRHVGGILCHWAYCLSTGEPCIYHDKRTVFQRLMPWQQSPIKHPVVYKILPYAI